MARAGAELERGRDSYARRAWLDAFGALTAADRAEGLDAEDLELLARSAYMLGRDDDYVDCLERAHRAHLDGGEAPRAVRCAFWIGHNMLFRGETVRARGWFARARRLLERDGRDCAERGWLLIPAWLEQMARGDWEAGYATAAEAAAIGERFGDADLVWLARDAARCSGRGGSRTGCGSSTRRWSSQPPGSCRRSWRASSTATRSPSAATPTRSAALASGPTP